MGINRWVAMKGYSKSMNLTSSLYYPNQEQINFSDRIYLKSKMGGWGGVDMMLCENEPN